MILQHGIPDPLLPQAVALYWQAFGGKLGRVLGPEARALAFLRDVIRPEQAIVAISRHGPLLGLGGFRLPAGPFAGGTPADLRRHYGAAGALWRAAVLGRLADDGPDDGCFLIDGLCVAPELRGQGVGTALVGALCGEARRRGYGAVRLDVVDTNRRARALYERLGFAVVRETPVGLMRPVFGFRATLTMVRPLQLAAATSSDS